MCVHKLVGPGASPFADGLLSSVLVHPTCLPCLQVPDLYDPRTQWASYIINAIKAKELFIKDVNYIVKNKEVSERGRTFRIGVLGERGG